MRLTDQMRSDLQALQRDGALSPSRARPLIKRGLAEPAERGYKITDKGRRHLPVVA